jgi:hypothetical protein
MEGFGMKKIYRGVSKKDGVWVYGNLIEVESLYILTEKDSKFLLVSSHCAASSGFVEILETSLGLYSGVQDKNGTPMFDGDIVCVEGNKGFLGVIRFGKYFCKCAGRSHNSVGFYIDWYDESGNISDYKPNGLLDYEKFLTVLGSVYFDTLLEDWICQKK